MSAIERNEYGIVTRGSQYQDAVQVRDLGALGAGTTTLGWAGLRSTIILTVNNATTRRIVLPLMPRGSEIEFQCTMGAVNAILEVFETLPSGATAAVQTRTSAGVAQDFVAHTPSGGNADATQDADFGVAAPGQLRPANANAVGTYLLRLKKIREYATAAVAADGWIVSGFCRAF